MNFPILVQLISLLIFSHTFLASSLYLVQRFSILYFTFDNGLVIRTETLRLFILCQFLLILNFKLARCFSELFLYYGTQDKKCAIKSDFKHHKQSSKNPFEIEFVTLHRNLMLKVKARARHACTTRLACRRSRICAY